MQVSAKVKMRILAASRHVGSFLYRLRARSQPTACESRVIADLRTEGVHVTTVEQLFPRSAPAIQQALAQAHSLLVNESARAQLTVWRGASSTDLAASDLIARFPELYLLGLNPKILALAQRYLQAPVAYHGAVIRHSLVDGEIAGPRLWHRDAEDFHVLRMVVYLNDVAPGGGPFEYAPRGDSVNDKVASGREGRYTSEEFASVVAPERWKRVMAPAGTVILCDTATVFHHESIQTETPRSVVMIGFSTRRPKNARLAMRHFPVESVKAQLMDIVPEANHPHVFGWRRPVS